MSQISSLPNSGVTDSPLITPGTASTSSSVKPDAAPQSSGPDAGQPAPTTLHNLQNAGARMQEMARVAVDRAGGLPCLEGNTLDRIKSQIPRPAIFSGRASYNAMTHAAEDCDAAARALSMVPVGEFSQNPISDEAFDALQYVVKAQNAFSASIDAFVKETGKSSPGLESLRQAAQFRAAEALNFAASMQAGIGAPDRTVTEGIRQMSPEMHGGVHILNNLRDEAAALFDRIDSLQAKQGQMPVESFRQEIADLRKDMDALKGKLSTQRQKAKFTADDGVFGALDGMISRAGQRLDNLAKLNPQAGVYAAVNAALPRISDKVYQSVAEHIPYGKREALATAVNNYNATVKRLLDGVENGTISRQDLEQGMRDAADALDCSATDDAIALFCDMQSNKLPIPPALEHFVLRTPAAVPQNKFTGEINEVCGMLDAVRLNNHARVEYITAAYEHNLDLQTVVEASLRGIPLDQLELEAGDGVLTEARKLGQGAANSVDLCVYNGKDGEDRRLVFKPELGARRGLERLTAGVLGYNSQVRAMQLNVAAHRAAEALGCGSTIAKSRIGCHEGEIGLFMEQAQGRAAYDLQRGSVFCRAADGTELRGRGVYEYLAGKGLLATARANVMRECNNLEWADLLSGQVDRHGDNYLLYLDPDTGEARITGIDNDASFGSRRLGANQVDVSGDDPRFQALLEDLHRVGVTPVDGRVDLTGMSNEQVAVIRRHLGFNQASLPAAIDRTTYDHLMAIDENQYRESMSACMDEDAVNAAMTRLDAAKKHAMELESLGCVIDNWAAPATEVIIRDSRVPVPLDGGNDIRAAAMVQNGFYNRDLAYFLEPLPF